ncbi:MAG: hypothetical protein JWM80_349 [Cyanobacteria bacterium RYN_339]|nr:hypothetical protein [Cyanobacteria bacterium RYN_339]
MATAPQPPKSNTLASIAAGVAVFVVVAGTFKGLTFLPGAWRDAMPQLPGDGKQIYPIPPALPPLAEADNARGLLTTAGSNLTGEPDFSLLQKRPLPDMNGFIEANAKFVNDNLARLDALTAARAKAGLRMTVPGDAPGAYQQTWQACYNLNNLGYIAFETYMRGAHPDNAAKVAGGLIAMDGRLRASQREGYNPALQGVYGISGLATSFRRHRVLFMKAETPTLTALLADLNAAAAARTPIEALTVDQREFLVRSWQHLPEEAAADPKTYKLAASGFDRFLLWYVAARSGDATFDRFRGIFDRTVTAVGTRDFATLRQARAGIKWGLPSPLYWGGIEPADFRLMALLHPVEGSLAMCLNAGAVGEQVYNLLKGDADLDAWRAQVAMELYRRANNKPPADLAALVPTYLPAVPADPFLPEQPLHFANEHMWSVGPDGHDDGGRRGDATVVDPLNLEAGVDIFL